MFSNLAWGLIGAAALLVGIVVLVVIWYTWQPVILLAFGLTVFFLTVGKHRNDTHPRP